MLTYLPDQSLHQPQRFVPLPMPTICVFFYCPTRKVFPIWLLQSLYHSHNLFAARAFLWAFFMQRCSWSLFYYHTNMWENVQAHTEVVALAPVWSGRLVLGGCGVCRCTIISKRALPFVLMTNQHEIRTVLLHRRSCLSINKLVRPRLYVVNTYLDVKHGPPALRPMVMMMMILLCTKKV